MIIASFGLPFLPGRESSARKGRPELPSARPSLNVAVYKEGRRALYLLQEIEPSQVTWAAGTETTKMGASSFSSVLEQGQRRCMIDLDMPLPGREQRLTGTVRMGGPQVRVANPPAGDPRHQWTPLCTATSGQAELEVDGRPFLSLRGRGYHDRNGSTEPLDALGIRHWLWGRAPSGDGERIWYLLWPTRGEPIAWGLEVGRDGAAVVREDLQVVLAGPRLGWFGMPWHQRIELRRQGEPWLHVEHDQLVDDGFFYQRWLALTRSPDGSVGRGVAEAVRPRRVDQGWNRWLVRMAVHRPGGRNSPFLPLFAGVIDRGSRALPAEVTA